MINRRSLCAIALSLFVTITPSFALVGYTVKTGDSLWRIASRHSVAGISTANMVKAIKGLNVESYPGITDNIVKVGQPLTLPTTAKEAKEAIQLLSQKQNVHLAPVEKPKVVETPKPTAATEAPTQNVFDSENQALTTKTSEPTKVDSPLKTDTKPKQTAEVKETPNHSVTYYQRQNQDFQISIEKQEVKNEALEKQLTQEKEDGHIIWGIVILVLIILALIWRKRKRAATEDDSANVAKKRFSGGTSSVEPNVEGGETIAPTLNVNEALVEAMILLEEGDIQNAKSCLQNALHDYPENIDIRIKLLEIYGAENDSVSFESERDYLSAHLLTHDDPRWEEIENIYHQYFV